VPHWTPHPEVVTRPLGDVLVIVSLRTNQIYELNATGSRIWEMCAAGRSRDEVVATLASEFDKDPAEIAAGFDVLEADLRNAELIDVASHA